MPSKDNQLPDVTDELDKIAETFLQGFEPNRVRAILAEARRLRERRSQIPWYQQQAQNRGEVLWLQLAISYAGDD
jgi:hypothetical protein